MNKPKPLSAKSADQLVALASQGVNLVQEHAIGRISDEEKETLQAFSAAILAAHLNQNSDLSQKIQSFSLTIRAVYLYGRKSLPIDVEQEPS